MPTFFTRRKPSESHAWHCLSAQTSVQDGESTSKAADRVNHVKYSELLVDLLAQIIIRLQRTQERYPAVWDPFESDLPKCAINTAVEAYWYF